MLDLILNFSYYYIMNKIIAQTLIIILLPFALLTFSSCGQSLVLNDKSTIQGVWWWDNTLSDEYLNFAYDNGIDEIYYCDSSFTENTSNFIKKANEKDITVYFLCGEYQWIENRQDFDALLTRYQEFQNNYQHNFEGIHLDVEPHQHPEFDTRRNELIQSYINFLYETISNYDNITFDADIPFWLEDKITFNNETKEAYKLVIDYCNRTFIMRYRDTAEGIYNVAKEELEYSKEIGKLLFLGVETGNEEDIVTFAQENKQYMYEQLNSLNKIISQDYGISIHHIKTWYNLKLN